MTLIKYFVMAKNVMNMTDIRNHVHRGGFDLSYKHAFTSKVGEILPCFVKEVLPGDKFTINLKSFTRTTPVDTAAYTRIREYVDFYFVPYRLLWDKFPQWVQQTPESFYASGVNASANNIAHSPYITAGEFNDLYHLFDADGSPDATDICGLSIYQQAYKLADLLGYGCYASIAGTTRSETAINVWRFAAYQKIYQDYFRFQQWESASPFTYNFDYVLSDSSSHIVFPSIAEYFNNGMFTLRYCNWNKDLSMGLLPSPQYGSTAAAGPLTGTLLFSSLNPGGVTSPNLFANATSSYRTDSPTTSWVMNAIQSPSTSLSNTSGISVFAIRQAEQLQKWSEITNSGRQDFKGQLEKHWNVNVPDYASDLCKWLGGTSSNIEISEVVNSNLSDTGVSSIAGKGVGAGSSGSIHFDSGSEYGIVMGIYHAVPLLDYVSDLWFDKQLLKTSPTDFPIPELDSIGMQEVLLHQLYQGKLVSPATNVIGYAPRYFEYKTSRDIVSGGFSHGGYSSWVAPVDGSLYSGSPTTWTYTRFKVHPSILNPIFQAQVTSDADITFSNDQLLNNIYFDVTAVRSLSETGLPY